MTHRGSSRLAAGEDETDFILNDSPTKDFDLAADPAENQDLSRARPDLVRQLEARLQELIR